MAREAAVALVVVGRARLPARVRSSRRLVWKRLPRLSRRVVDVHGLLLPCADVVLVSVLGEVLVVDWV